MLVVRQQTREVRMVFRIRDSKWEKKKELEVSSKDYMKTKIESKNTWPYNSKNQQSNLQTYEDKQGRSIELNICFDTETPPN